MYSHTFHIYVILSTEISDTSSVEILRNSAHLHIYSPAKFIYRTSEDLWYNFRFCEYVWRHCHIWQFFPAGGAFWCGTSSFLPPRQAVSRLVFTVHSNFTSFSRLRLCRGLRCINFSLSSETNLSITAPIGGISDYWNTLITLFWKRNMKM